MKENSVGLEGLTALIGQDDAQTFVRHFGGREYRFPENSHSKQANRLRQILGDKSANTLLDHFAGDKPYVRTEKMYFVSLRNKKFLSDLYELLDDGVKKTTALHILCPKYGFTKRWGDKIVTNYEKIQKNSDKNKGEESENKANKTR